jgi:3-hydroxyacyl-CoA dehydrogenase/enoyl-CoA hydratase/3-hydroxybutyryl-CoA epimerase
MGAKAFVELAEKLAGTYGKHFKPTPLLKDMAAKGETFYGRFDPYAKVGKAA